MASSGRMSIEELLPDFPPGPLDNYRKSATFDWKKFKLILETEEVIRFKHVVWSAFESDPVFAQTPWQELSRDDIRRVTLLRMKRLFEYNFLTEEDMISAPLLISGFIQCLVQYDVSLAAKKFMSLDVFVQSARTTGSKEHASIIKQVKNCEVLGALSITELSHGSNIAGIQTKATFDADTQEFVLNTPCLEATKCWSGILGQTATHANVFAQLFTPDGKCHGVHQFLTPIRDPKSLLPFPGILVGDMGPKLGINGNDNGYMQFTNYRIPKSALMNKHTQITPEGKLVTKKMDAKRRQGIALGVLSMGRISIVYLGILHLQMALTIAIRYSAVRKQFGPKKSIPNGQSSEGNQSSADPMSEWPVIEYQTQQWRLFPFLAATFAHLQFYKSLQKEYMMFYADIAYGFNLIPEAEKDDLGSEIHALTCASKALVSWKARDGIQECRESCGGHGYLKAARFGELRDDHDPNMTHEGECYVMLMQTSNYLVKKFQEKKNNRTKLSTPLKSINFINDYQEKLTKKMRLKDFNKIETIIDAYEYLVCYLLVKSDEKLEKELESSGGDLFTAKSNSQIFYLQSLSTVYFECECIKRFDRYIFDDEDFPPEISKVMERLLLLYGLTSLQKHIPTLFEADFFPPRYELNPVGSIQEVILRLLKEIKPDAVALVDTIAPPDFIMNSCLGYSDGDVYRHIFDAISKSNNSQKRPEWYQEFTERKPNIDSLRDEIKSKL